MSRFEGTTCDSCGYSVKDTRVTGWAEVTGWSEVTFWGLVDNKVFDICPQCASRVNEFIENGFGREYTRGEKGAEQ